MLDSSLRLRLLRSTVSRSVNGMGRSSRARAERRGSAAKAPPPVDIHSDRPLGRGCLFCRETTGGFLSREHVLPESMGNTDKVLPAGVVCDRCNNGPLSVIDQALCDFHPVKVWRTLHGIRTKDGKFPMVRTVDGTLTYLPPPETGDDPILFFKSNAKGRSLLRPSTLEDGKVAVEASLTGGRPVTSRLASQLSRALLKMAVELLWLDDRELAQSPDLDHVRARVLGETSAGFFAMIEGPTSLANADAEVTYQTCRTERDRIDFVVLMRYKGLVVFTDSQHESLPALPLMPSEIRVVAQTFGTDPQLRG